MESALPPLPQRPQDSHKGIFGRVLVIAGSPGMTGAGALSSQSALRSGAGLVTWAIPKSLNNVAALASLEVMTLPIPETAGQEPAVDAREYLLEAAMEVDAVVLGPGLPVAGETGELMRLLIPELRPPLVVDAGGLTAVGTDWKIFRKRKAATVITPHPGEMARLVNKSSGDVQNDREGFAGKYAKHSGAIVVLKGANTIIANGSEVRTNTNGNSGMATAGAGDVLAGVIAGLIAQGMEAFDAATLGTYLHGLAGDITAGEFGEYGMIAGDILQSLPKAFLQYANSK